MSKLNRIVAIIALALVGAATVLLILFLIDREMFRGLDMLLMFTAGFGLLLYVYLWITKKQLDKQEKLKKEIEEEEAAAKAAGEAGGGEEKGAADMDGSADADGQGGADGQ